VEVQVCKAHKPVFREVASAFASHHDVLVAQFDASEAEDVRKKYSIEGYPAVIFFGKAQK
jgi:thiol-disulfide isomerase/thioredoxin